MRSTRGAYFFAREIPPFFAWWEAKTAATILMVDFMVSRPTYRSRAVQFLAVLAAVTTFASLGAAEPTSLPKPFEARGFKGTFVLRASCPAREADVAQRVPLTKVCLAAREID